jgi:hypothetical protein
MSNYECECADGLCPNASHAGGKECCQPARGLKMRSCVDFDDESVTLYRCDSCANYLVESGQYVDLEMS